MSDVEYAKERILLDRRMKCEQKLNSSTIEIEGLYCPGVFDNWNCWPDTPANTTAETQCPYFVDGFDEKRIAYRYCDPFGEWFRHPSSNRTWSNYSTCIDQENFKWHKFIISLHEIGYSISLVALILSLALLFYFKTLRCARITIHMNLFASFAMNNTLWLLWYRFVVREPHVLEANKMWCQILHVVLHYFLLTNYTWMLCEGFYLHTVLISAFVSEGRLLKWLIALGWGMPFVAIVVYTIARGRDYNGSQQCWINDSPFLTILIVPGGISMFLNVVFLCNIVRVLLIKLRGGPHVQGACGPSRTALQAFRATLLLVPLLGLHYFLTPFNPPPKHPWAKTYEVTSAISASFQGLCVATLFCFCNGEVMAQIRRRWRNVMFRPRANSCTATTVSVRKRKLTSRSDRSLFSSFKRESSENEKRSVISDIV
ncbi:calcitonin gene-related peptide type 1 receptor-like [Chrysoperla carnea]|uniref:calcitonin gene-related peptide type 1 receptor-like n=1 Tax=Chrysoperla carnea TaxID=189513 RepID=UPI001D081681|nr:calcitonin gene-related peptide type 1 receptor-like [Chrysoperla carnea]